MSGATVNHKLYTLFQRIESPASGSILDELGIELYLKVSIK